MMLWLSIGMIRYWWWVHLASIQSNTRLTLRIPVNGQAYLATVTDGLLIQSSESLDFFQKVPGNNNVLIIESTLNVFNIGSTHPGAVLYDASDLFHVYSFFINRIIIQKQMNIYALLNMKWKKLLILV